MIQLNMLLQTKDVRLKQFQKSPIHFFCSNCNKTICLDKVTIPNLELPEDPKGLRNNSMNW